MSEKTTVAFDSSVDPDDVAKMRRIVAAAKKSQVGGLKGGRDRRGPPDVRGRFDNPMSDVEGPGLSEESAQGLEAMANANPAPTKAPEPAPVQAVPVEDAQRMKEAIRIAFVRSGRGLPDSELLTGVLAELNAVPEPSKDDRIRARTESELRKIDVGDYIMQGYVTQKVPIVPDRLDVVYRSSLEREEFYAEQMLRKDLAADATMNEMRRATMENGLAIQIHAYNGTKWPALMKKDRTIDEEAFQTRLGLVREIGSHLFGMIGQHLVWFNDRVGDALTLEALGNG